MNWLDIVIFIPVIWGAYQGYKKGLVYMIAMIIGLVLGLYLAFKLDGWMSDFIREHTESNSKFIPYLSFFIILSTVILILVFFAKLLEQILKISSLNTFNKVAGAFMGAAKFAFIVSIVLFLLRNFEPAVTLLSPQVRDESFSYNYVKGFAAMINPALESIKDEFEENVGRIDTVLPAEKPEQKKADH